MARLYCHFWVQFGIDVWVSTRRSGSGGSCDMTSVRVMPGICWKSEELLLLTDLWGGIR